MMKSLRLEKGEKIEENIIEEIFLHLKRKEMILRLKISEIFLD